jgi:hypothetical protein
MDLVLRTSDFVHFSNAEAGVSAAVAARRGSVGRDGILLRERFRQTGKTALRFDPAGGRGGPCTSTIPLTNDQHPGLPAAGVTFDQTAAKRRAPRRF